MAKTEVLGFEIDVQSEEVPLRWNSNQSDIKFTVSGEGAKDLGDRLARLPGLEIIMDENGSFKILKSDMLFPSMNDAFVRLLANTFEAAAPLNAGSGKHVPGTECAIRGPNGETQEAVYLGSAKPTQDISKT